MTTEITEQFQRVLDFLASSTPQVLFVTGSAGTGKSTLIEVMRNELDKNLVVVAPTGVAALNIRGQTIHSLFQFPPGPQPRARRVNGNAREVLKQMDILVIDEISMVRADLLDSIDDALRLNSDYPDISFGGKTIVMIGDLFQLPPVVTSEDEQNLFRTYYESPYFFSAFALAESSINTITLTESFRQPDPVFFQILNNIRAGFDLEKSVDLLNKYVGEELGYEYSRLILTSVNTRAKRYNEKLLAELPGKNWCFEAEIDGDWNDKDSQLPSPIHLNLKVDAQVMFTKNGPDWVNGSLGRIKSIDEDVIEVELLTSRDPQKIVFVERYSWERFRYRWDNERARVNAESVGMFIQFPFILAWAVTIHKAQGLTLDNVHIDLSAGMFAAGQLYVALSRCRSLDSISISRPLDVSDIKYDSVISSFYKIESKQNQSGASRK